jgi:predicted amidophosphoribosyltransferase
MFTEPLDALIRGYKENPALTRGLIFGRLVLGWLHKNVHPENVDLIVANPTFSESGQLGHTEMVLAHARREDLLVNYPIDYPDRPTLIKTAATPKSRNSNLSNKRAVADALGEALALTCAEDAIEGSRVIVYDDVCTSGSQLNAVARFLRDRGAASVRGLVLARAPWRS